MPPPPPPPTSTAPSSTPVLAPAFGYIPPPPLANSEPPNVDDIINRAVERAVGRAFDRAFEHAVHQAAYRAANRAIDGVITDIYNLYIGRLEWTEDTIVCLTSAQHGMLSKISPSRWNGTGPIRIGLLDFAGRLLFTQHYGDGLASKIAENLLRVAQDKAGTMKKESWNHRIVLLLNKRVKVKVDGKSHSGILTGITTEQTLEEPPFSPHVHGIQLSKSKELVLDSRGFDSGDAYIQELGETASETVNHGELEEMIDY